jgi:uncharacterized repeat protein (TIGR01451 family)
VVINLTPTLPWSLPNHTGLVTSPNANPGMDASATLHAIYNVGGLLSAPTVSEAFSPPTVPVGGTSQMTITLSNPNAIAITNAQFSDTYPSGMVNASSGVVVSNSCGGSLTAVASGTMLVLSGGTVPANDECSIVVAVTGTAAGVYDNHTGVVTSANADFSADASAALTVTDGGLLPAPTITKAFSPSSVSVGETSLMTITLNNPAGSAITGVNLDDVYPSGMINAPEPTVASDSCNFQELVLANGSSAMLSNGTIPPGDSCSVVISVIGTAEGIFTNTTGSVYSDNAQTAAPGSATLTVTSSPPLSAPTVLKTFAPDSVPVGGVSLMTITLFNSNVSNAILGVGLDDIYPAGIISAPGNPVIGDTCFFNEDVPANGGWAKLSGGTLTPGGECSIMINVVGTATATNQTGPTTSSNAPIGASASATLTVTGAPLLPSPTATKTFTPAHINVGGTSQMTITLTNHSSNAVTGVQLTDVYPGGMVNAPGNSVVSDSCNFQELVPAAGGSATLTGGTIPAGNGNTCSIVIDVIGTSSGGWTNWTSPILSDNAASGASTSAMLQVSGSLINLQAPIATQTFSPASVVVGGTSKLTITLSNPAVNASAITGVQFTDTYVPAHMTNALSGASTDCGGSLTATPGDSVLTLTGGIIPVNGACNVTVDVIGTSIGTSTSDTGPVLSNNADPGANATATLTVTGGALLNAPIVQKSFTPASVNMGDISQMKISLTNPNASAITGVQVNDLYPAGIRNGPSSPVISDTCNFNEDVPGDGTWAKMYGGTIPGNGGCSIVINVVGTSTATNQTGPVPSGNALTGISANATLTVVGGAVNHPPVAVGDAIEVAPNGTANTLVGDTNVPASVLDNDSDPDAGDTLTATKVSDPSHGTVVLNADGTFLYQNDGTGTTDSFTYQACDSSNECSAETAVTITIGTGLSNHAPFAVDDAIQMTAGDTVDTLVGNPNTPSSVLDNDIDPDGDALTATKLTDPAYGDLTFSANGTFSYHNTAPATSDSFLYEACDAGGACALGRVAITIDANPSNRLPIVVDDAIQTTPNGSADTLIGDPNGVDSVLDNDSDPDASDVLTAAKASGLVNASGTVTLQSDGTFLYQNTDPSVATDMFLYEACDGEGACTPGIVSITISNGPMDLPPIAMDDALEVAPGGSTSTIVGDPNTVDSVLDNDSDPDAGDALVAHLISPPANGDITLNTNGTFTYVNTSLNAATDEFRYEACDGHGACVAATVSVVINQSAPTVLCVLPRQVDVVGDTVNIDLAQLFTAPAGQSLIYSADNLPPSLSIVGSLLSGILQASDVPGSPYASTLRATTVLSNVSATENVIFQVLPTGEIVLRNGFDGPNPTQPCT